MYKLIFSLLLLTGILSACGSDELTIPKPPTFLNVNLPAHTYMQYQTDCPYSFDIPKI